jgi:hypothetical protein
MGYDRIMNIKKDMERSNLRHTYKTRISLGTKENCEKYQAS